MDQLNEPLAEHTVVDGFAGLRIALIYPLPGLASVPCLADACRLWARLGASVAVFCVEHDTLPSPSFDEDEVNVMPHLPGLFKRAHIHCHDGCTGTRGSPTAGSFVLPADHLPVSFARIERWLLSIAGIRSTA